MKHCRKWLPALAILAGMLVNSRCTAQEYIFNHLSTRDGLASNAVLSLCQTSNGYLWVGTENGLQRYDGYRFTFPFPVSIRQPVNQILLDRDSAMWLRMGSTVGIFNHSTGQLQQVKIPDSLVSADPSLFELQEDAGKNIFLIIKGRTCLFANDAKTAFDGHNRSFSFPDAVRVNNVFYDREMQRYWISGSGGFGFFDLKEQQFFNHQNAPPHEKLLVDEKFADGVTQFYIDAHRRYWIERTDSGNGKQFYCFDETKNNFIGDTAGLADAGTNGYFKIYRFEEFNDTTVLIYGLNCMSMIENGRFEKFMSPFTTPFSIQFNVVHDVLEDREKILWVATDDGLYNTMANLHSNSHLAIGQDSGRSSINALMEDAGRNIWIGTWGRGILVLDSNLVKLENITRAFRRFHDDDLNYIWSLVQDPASGVVRAGCRGGKILVFDPSTNDARIVHPQQFQQSTVRQLVQDHAGATWIGLENGKLFKAEHINQTAQPYTEVQHFAGPVTTLEPANNLLWVAVAGQGVYSVDIKTGVMTNRGKLAGNEVQAILPLGDSTCLFAGDWLDQLDTKTGRVVHIAEYDRGPLGKIYSLQKGLSRDCWLSTTNGLYRYHVPSRTLTRYSQWDGLITVINSSFLLEHSLTLRNGKLVFAGNQNFVMFDPAHYGVKGLPPEVLITNFQLTDQYLPVDSVMRLPTLQLDYRQHSFTISFAALSFTQLEKLTYEYRLDGVEKNWTTASVPQPVRYSLLRPGNYVFEVRSRNGEGVYSASTTSIRIHIAPPFWQTWWFLGLAALLLVVLFYYLHRLRLKRLLHVEQVRSRLARDLHDDMGSTLSTINILSNMAMQKQGSGERGEDMFMKQINQSTSQMMESMDDIVWSINPSNDSMGKVLARMKQVAGAVLEPQGIDYSFHADEQVKQLAFTMEHRREIFLIYKEAINNIVKYAKSKNVRVILKRQSGEFVLQITDDGTGFDAESPITHAATRGNGLVNMKRRAQAMKGVLTIETAPEKGTTVTLAIPVG